MVNIKEYTIKQNELKRPVLEVKEEVQYELNDRCNSPSKVVKMIDGLFDVKHLAEEYVWMVCLTTDLRVIGLFEISHGAATHSIMNPREILIKALMTNATEIIMVHCHPSGNPEPSDPDVLVTSRLNSACDLIGIELADHIIIGCDEELRYYSFKESDVL